MGPVLRFHPLFLTALLICLGCAAGFPDPLYGDINSTNNTALRLLENLQKSNRRIPPPPVTWPYVNEGCCNLSTTDKCAHQGGECIPRNETCVGKTFIGDDYCSFNHLKSCQCCVPANCETLDPCKKVNGTCSLTCPGKSVSGKEWCKDSPYCRCCLPEPLSEPGECPCGQDRNGGCKGQYSYNKWTYGTCEKTCSKGTVELDHHSCTKTGGVDCKCCGKEIPVPCEDTWPTNPTICIDYRHGGACGCKEVVSNGYCTNPIYSQLAMMCQRSCKLCDGPGFSGPYNSIWAANQCEYIGSIKTVTPLLCKFNCLKTPRCTAVNYTPDTGNCGLRACPLPVPPPQTNKTGSQGYARITECELPYEWVNNQCLRFIYNLATWNDSRDNCLSMDNTDLAVLNDIKKVAEYMRTKKKTFNPNWFHIGANNRGNPSMHTWINGTDISPSRGDPWEHPPRSNEPSLGKDNCVHINPVLQGGVIADNTCNIKLPYICQKQFTT